MANILNKQICSELTELFKEANDCVFVDFQGLTVEEVNTFRSSLTSNQIRMQVIRSSLTNLVLKDMNRSGYEKMLDGQTAVVWGGESIVQISKSVDDFAKKSKKLKIKGGFLGEGTITVDDVKKLTTVPDTPILMGLIVGAFMDPLQGMTSGLNSILSSLVTCIDGVKEKKENEG